MILTVPARIASFGQIIQLPLRTATTLSCLAVGNPIPRTRWMHRGRAVTHSPHYQVTQKGHLEIHSMFFFLHQIFIFMFVIL